MPFSFPSSPTVGQTSTQNGRVYQYAGNNVWELAVSGSGGSLSGSVTIPGLGDPLFSNVSLLLHFDGTGSTFVDSSGVPKTITAVGNATQSATQSKFGGKSLYLDGTDDRITASSADFAFGTGDVVIEFWLRAANVSAATQPGVFQTSGTSGGLATSYGSGVLLVLGAGGINQDGDGRVMVNLAGTWLGSGTTAVVQANQWHHVAISRASGTARLYVDGAMVGSATATGNCTGQNLCIGGYYDSTYLMTGYIDDFRVTRGSARSYTGSAVPVPDAAYPDGTSLALPVTITGSGGGSGLSWSSVPASASATGTAGSIAYDDASGFFYVATAQNTWKRAALSTWSNVTPASVTGLQLWLDASDASTLYDATSGGSLVAADGAVARWQDKSGNGRHATQSTSGSRPLRKVGVRSGKDVLRFDGTNDFLTSADFLDLSSGQSITAFAVVKRAATGAYHAILSKFDRTGGAATEDGWSFRFTDTDKCDAVFFKDANGTTVLSNNTVSGSSFSLLAFKATAGSFTTSTVLYANGSEIASSSTGTVQQLDDTGYPLQIGIEPYSGTFYSAFSGDIAEIVIYNSALNNSDRADVENYLMNKWSIT